MGVVRQVDGRQFAVEGFQGRFGGGAGRGGPRLTLERDDKISRLNFFGEFAVCFHATVLSCLFTAPLRAGDGGRFLTRSMNCLISPRTCPAPCCPHSKTAIRPAARPISSSNDSTASARLCARRLPSKWRHSFFGQVTIATPSAPVSNALIKYGTSTFPEQGRLMVLMVSPSRSWPRLANWSAARLF